MKNSCSNIYFQAFPLANLIFAGIGVFLLVCILHCPPVQLSLTPMTPRQLKMPALARSSLLSTFTALDVSSICLSFTLASHRLRL